MNPIVTLTMNTALDVGTSIGRIEPEKKLRCGSAGLDPGGGGINVARVVHRLGGRATAVYTVGGPIGAACRQLVEAEGIDGRPVPIGGDTRLDFTVDETEADRQYRFVLRGPSVAEDEWRNCLDVLEELVERDGFLVASGSLPPGVPDDFYARVARLANARGARLCLDTSGPALAAALEEGVHFVKPNRRELAELTGTALESPDEERDAAVRLLRDGSSEIVALTLGADGAVLASRDQVLRVPAPAVEQRSAVGAGDSFVGAFVLSLAEGRPLEQALRRAAAAGGATLMTPGTSLCRKPDVERLEQEIGEIAREDLGN